MVDSPESRPSRYGILSIAALVIVGGGFSYTLLKRQQDIVSTENFEISVPPPAKGWHALDHGPQTLFLYSHNEKGLILRGAVNQMVSSVNPTPNLDRDGLAQLMVDNTHDNMPGWTADVKDVVKCKGTSFRVIRRSEKKHVVVTAFAVKGNTTVLISLAGRDDKADQVDKDMAEFEKFVTSVTMTKADSSKW